MSSQSRHHSSSSRYQSDNVSRRDRNRSRSPNRNGQPTYTRTSRSPSRYYGTGSSSSLTGSSSPQHLSSSLANSLRSSSPPSSRHSTPVVPAGADGDSDDEGLSGSKVPSIYLTEKGRILGRCLAMWTPIRPIIEQGYLISQSATDVQLFTKTQQNLYKIYVDLRSLAPQLPDIVTKLGTDAIPEIARHLEQGRNKARSSDINSLKANIHLWREFDPPLKPTQRFSMGFHNDSSGRLLCPPDLNWDDPNIRTGLKQGTIQCQPGDYPRFLWMDETYDPNYPFRGFLKGDLLVKGIRHIFIGPSAAHDDRGRNTRKGNAAIHGIQSVPLWSVVYIAVLIRFVLCDQTTFAAGGKTQGQWPFRTFYKELSSTVNSLETEEAEELVTWWNETIFSDFLRDEEDSAVAEGGRSSIGQKMRMRATSGTV